MLLLPGVLVGDMGPKIGLNGVDNGFATFNEVRIPRENLLNKTGDVTQKGEYITPFKVNYFSKNVLSYIILKIIFCTKGSK